MNEEHAVDVLDMLVSATTNYELDPRKRELWITQLSPLSAEIATNAVIRGMREWDHFPSWAQFYDAYVAERNKRVRDSAIAENQEAVKRGESAPEWVYVWWWCRNNRHPQEERRFPQQGPHPEALSMPEYEELRGEWAAAGSPRPISDALLVIA